MERFRKIVTVLLLTTSFTGSALAREKTSGEICSGDVVSGRVVTSSDLITPLRSAGEKFLYVGKGLGNANTMGVSYNQNTGVAHFIDTNDTQPLDNGIWERISGPSGSVCVSSPILEIDITPYDSNTTPDYVKKLQRNFSGGIDLANAVKNGARPVISGRLQGSDGRASGKKFVVFHDLDGAGEAYVIGSDLTPELYAAFGQSGTTKAFDRSVEKGSVAARKVVSMAP